MFGKIACSINVAFPAKDRFQNLGSQAVCLGFAADFINCLPECDPRGNEQFPEPQAKHGLDLVALLIRGRFKCLGRLGVHMKRDRDHGHR